MLKSIRNTKYTKQQPYKSTFISVMVIMEERKDEPISNDEKRLATC